MTNITNIPKKGSYTTMQILTILVIEDEDSLLQLYRIVLEKEGFKVLTVHNGQEAWDLIENEHVDLVITDILMPVMDGYEFTELLRRSNPGMPVLMITAKDDFPSKNKGFSLGTDDYMTKPVNLDEMVLRVRALLRRSHIASDKRLTLPHTILDYDALTVTWEDDSQMLPQKEFFLLFKLISYPNKIFTRMQLMDEIWGRNSESDLQTIDVHINRLRRRFENNPDFEIITVRGLGYKAVMKE